jgi:hypothetical protein
MSRLQSQRAATSVGALYSFSSRENHAHCRRDPGTLHVLKGRDSLRVLLSKV